MKNLVLLVFLIVPFFAQAGQAKPGDTLLGRFMAGLQGKYSGHLGGQSCDLEISQNGPINDPFESISLKVSDAEQIGYSLQIHSPEPGKFSNIIVSQNFVQFVANNKVFVFNVDGEGSLSSIYIEGVGTCLPKF